MRKILLVEDDSRVSAFIIKGLKEEGYDVALAMDGKMGLQMALQGNYDLIILDIMIPEMNGIEVCKEIRKQDATVPVLFLTALGSTENVVMGLDSGADDYLSKPFKFIELLARVRTLMRRSSYSSGSESKSENTYRFGDLELDDDTKTVTRDGMTISLTSTEYRLLLMFMKNQRRVLSRIDILEEVWGIDFDMGTNVVDVYVNYLRKKLEKYNGSRLIQTVIGMGYVLKEAE
ncbi:DNA-binding response regulator [Echinicola strongylocentroti]|uniref:DNA-binding response regulator n=1 Tax=Echinicola strongylocentroti TaxID=1795355 RepID=A0A2Z4IMX7_9BACT|nr:response regulator transcription factor [Echinicola strongylocentroti]AWW32087.1 DNA-binding response regulator [Echinicola strongylocentroti]